MLLKIYLVQRLLRLQVTTPYTFNVYLAFLIHLCEILLFFFNNALQGIKI